MTSIILIPAVICILALCLQPTAAVFRNVVLPVLLLVPIYYIWKVPLLPPLDFADAVLIPLGVAMLLKHRAHWRYSLIDLFVFLFVLSTAVADLKRGETTTSSFELFDNLAEVVFPYMAGKLLIEQQQARSATVRRLVSLSLVAALLGIYEFPAKANLFRLVFGTFFRDQKIVWSTQLRGGHGRLSGPYAQAELAGMMLLLAIGLAFYLARSERWGHRFGFMPSLPLRKSWIAFAVLLAALYMTQSRGPELGLIIALPVAWIGYSRRRVRSTLLVTALLAVGGAVAYEGLVQYAATRTPTTEEQETAAYRVVLLESYLPMAEHSGAWGTGPSFSRIGKYESVDNEYLYLWLTQGWVGLASFLLLSAATLYHLLYAILYNPQRNDRSFAFTLLGIFLGLLVTLATVFLGMQPMIFFFLLVGWAQAVRIYPATRPHASFAQVYT